MKREFLVLLGIILVVGLSACKNRKEEMVSSGQVTRSYEKSDDGYMIIKGLDASRQVNLTMAGWEGGPSETDNVNNALEKFQRYYSNIKVQYTPSPDSGAGHHGKIMTMFAAGTAPDVFYCAATMVDGLASRNVLYDITDRYLEVFTRESYIPSALDIMTYNDRIYGISSSTSSAELYYNKDLFDEAGVPYPPYDPANPWTWDEFINASQKLTKKDASGKTTQYAIYGLEGSFMNAAYINQYGIKYLSDDGKTFLAADDPNFKNIFKNIKDLRTIHGVSPLGSFSQTAGMNTVRMLLTGKVAMFVSGTWSMEETIESGVHFGIAPLPVMPGAKSSSWGQGHIHSMVANTKNPEEAWALLVFLGGERYQLDLIREGLWMPSFSDMYTPDGIKRWLTPNHPDNFDKYSIYCRDYSPSHPSVVMGNEAADIYTEETERYFNGNVDLDTVVENMKVRINGVLANK
jgi:multiple sugar transport system substrate-binding protein